MHVPGQVPLEPSATPKIAPPSRWALPR
jgi:hypothetical protein